MHLAPAADSRTVVSPFRPDPPVDRDTAVRAASRTLTRLLERGGLIAAAVVDARGHLASAAGALEGAPLIVGRHSNADLQLRDASIALRQLALFPRRVDGQARTEVWDLGTELGFEPEPGERATAASARGDFELRFGGCWLVVRTRAPGRSWVEACARAAFPAGVEVTRVGPTRYLGERACGADTLAELESRVAGDARTLRIPISADALRDGLLVGRYPRCAIQAAGQEQLSRVHLLLAEVDRAPWAIDLASTNGTLKNGAELRAAPLAPGDRVSCAGVTLRWLEPRR